MRSPFCRALPLLSALAVGTAPVVARAAPSSSSAAEAKTHFQRAVKLYGEEDFRAALVEFKRAYELSENFAILYNVAQTQFQLRDYAGALESFQKYLSTGGARVPAARRKEVEKDLEDLQGRVAKVTFESSEPGAEISVDDVVIGKTPLGPVVVSSGQRTFKATKEGLPPVSRRMELAGGDEVVVSLDFARADAAPPPPPPAPPPDKPPAPPGGGPHPMVFVGYGVGLAGLGVGAAFGVVALGTKSDLDASCVDRVCPRSEQTRGDELTTQATISTIGFGVGLVGAVVGTYFLVAGKGDAKAEVARRAPAVQPWFAGTSAGVAGRF